MSDIKFYSKEIQIMRQSQNKLVVEYTRDLGVVLTVAELNRVTDVFVETCLAPVEGPLKERVKDLDKWLKTKIEEQNSSSKLLKG